MSLLEAPVGLKLFDVPSKDESWKLYYILLIIGFGLYIKDDHLI